MGNGQLFILRTTKVKYPKINTKYSYPQRKKINNNLIKHINKFYEFKTLTFYIKQYQKRINMFVSPTNSKRFNLYHLEQKQIYIQDFYGTCSFFDFLTNEKLKNDKGKFYLCSKSLIYESNSRNVPLMKYRFENMIEMPQFSDGIKFRINRLTMIRVSGSNPPEPFKIVEDLKENIEIRPSYENIRNLEQWLVFLYNNSIKKNNYDMEHKIYEMIIEKFNKKAFNMSLIDSVSEKPAIVEENVLTRRVLPLNHIYGYIFITNEKVYFEPFHNISAKSVEKIDISKIGKLFKRRYELRNIGLEIITDKSYYFTFQTETHRNQIFRVLSKHVPQNCIKIESLQRITYMWQNKEISNYEYLLHLNQAGNRSLSDLSQYPVFPWVLKDYECEEIDLEDESVYRDLSKPIGALNQSRLEQLLDRYESMEPPKFMYGSHYSTPGYVIGYLVRKKPEYMLKLQSGRFDKPDRLFKSIKDDWYNVYQNPTSLKQLIPEFYQDQTLFLKNYQKLDLGIRQNKQRVDDVELPGWAHGSPEKYLSTMKKALESDYVSNNLHKWIDLIFGYKQRGQQAIKSFNLFYHLTYEGMVDIDTIKDPIQKIALKDQINQFGQCPKQLFIIGHPPRSSTIIERSLLSNKEGEEEMEDKDEEDMIVPESKFSEPKQTEVSNLYSNGYPKVKAVITMGKQSDIRQSQIPRAHKNQITRAIHLQSKPNSLLTIGHDGFLKIFDVYEKTCVKSFKVCQFVLSCIVAVKNEETFAIGSWDNNIYLFNIVYGSRSKPFPAHDNSINDLIYLQSKKKLISASWDCSIKMFRYVGNTIDSAQQLYDHENQISCLCASNNENTLIFGDIEGNILGVDISEREQLFSLNMNSQKITRLSFLQHSIIALAESELRIVDIHGETLTTFFIDKNNGQITDVAVDGEHLFITTTRKQMLVYDVLQQKKIGNFFNDFTIIPKDRLPEEKQLTAVAVGNDGLFVAVGAMSGTIYVLRS